MFKKTGILLCLMLATASAQAFELNLNKLVDMSISSAGGWCNSSPTVPI